MLHVPEFYIGLDLGKRADFSAIAVVEFRPADLPHYLTPWTQPRPSYSLRQLWRVPLGTPYTEVVDRVERATRIPELVGRTTLVVDATGLGARSWT